MAVRVVAGSLIALLAASATQAADDVERPDAVPYRPTVSTPATLSAPGWLEGEFGGLLIRDRHADDGIDRRISVPYTLKYAFTDDWGVRLGGETFAHVRNQDGTTDSGFGDTTLVLKRRFAIDQASAFGLELGAAFATAKPVLQVGSGKTDWSVNGIYSVDLGAWHADVNLIDTRLGARVAGQSRSQALGAFAVSRPVSDRWTAEAEMSATRQHGVSSTAQVLAAMSLELRRDLVVDFGAAHGLNRASPTWQAFAGVTVVLGRLD